MTKSTLDDKIFNVSNFEKRSPEFAKILGMNWSMPFIATPNISDKKHDEIQTLVLHHTAIDLNATINAFVNQKQASANYVIDKNGSIINFGSDDKKLWHAGTSKFGYFTNLNDYGPGIELINNGVNEEYPSAQMAALIVLSHSLIKAYSSISPFNVLAHAEIAPNRKEDPSVYFDWKLLAKYGVGFFPNQDHYDSTVICKSFDQGPAVQLMKLKLYQWGYRGFESDWKPDEHRNFGNIVIRENFDFIDNKLVVTSDDSLEIYDKFSVIKVDETLSKPIKIVVDDDSNKVEIDNKFDNQVISAAIAFKRRYFPEEFKKESLHELYTGDGRGNLLWTQGNQDFIDLLIAKRNAYEEDKDSFQIDFDSLKDDNPLRGELLAYSSQLEQLGLGAFIAESVCTI